MNFGARLKEARIRAHLTQPQLAEKLGLANYQSVSQYERRESAPKIEMVRKMAEALSTSTQYLLGGTDDPNDYVDITKSTSLGTALKLIHEMDKENIHVVLLSTINALSKDWELSEALVDLIEDCIDNEDEARFLLLFNQAEEPLQQAVLTILQHQLPVAVGKDGRPIRKKPSQDPEGPETADSNIQK